MWLGGQRSEYDQSEYFYFYTPDNLSHTPSHIYTHPTTGKFWMQTAGGYYLWIYNTVISKWENDGDGSGIKGYGAYFRII